MFSKVILLIFLEAVYDECKVQNIRLHSPEQSITSHIQNIENHTSNDHHELCDQELCLQRSISFMHRSITTKTQLRFINIKTSKGFTQRSLSQCWRSICILYTCDFNHTSDTHACDIQQFQEPEISVFDGKDHSYNWQTPAISEEKRMCSAT